MNLAEFAKWAIENSAFKGNDLDGADVEQKALACGLLTKTVYDPEIHGGSSEAEKGDPWFVFSTEFCEAIKATAT